MKTKWLSIGSWGLAAMMAVFASLTAARLPEGAALPIHWNAVGEPDRSAPALVALLWPAGMAALMAVVFAAIPRIEPLQNRLDKSAPLLRTAWIGVLAVLIAVQLATGLPAWGVPVSVKLIFVAMGLLFLALGNVLPKSRPGFFVGIRTPWTLTNDDVWIATHRLGGKMMMLAGLAIVAAGLLPISPEATATILLIAVGLAAVLPIVYSWWLWRTRDSAKG